MSAIDAPAGVAAGRDFGGRFEFGSGEALVIESLTWNVYGKFLIDL
jgi:hypothetical protein